MAKAKESTVRIFVKKGADGNQLTREVTSAASEVAARFDGFVEKSSGAKSASTTTSSTSSSH